MVRTGSEIRESFLDFFASRGHARVASSSLIPKDDPTLLFTNSGMVQFKNCFLGKEERSYKRAVSSQKCLRAGGKHNDLENVGLTSRHHTFFEMLGNFSFGDYFKKEAISWSWEYLTEVLGISKERLWITIYRDDDEAFRIWNGTIGVPEERIVRMGEESNFWMMGDTGPCGPCSEIIYDQGEKVGCGLPTCAAGCECDRYLEIWNLVFTQFDRDAAGRMTPLPNPNIDTGMGIERLAAVLQGVTSNYATDLFQEIIASIQAVSGRKYGENGEDDIAIRVIADHSRAVTFMVGDGMIPANEGRGYVLRRILRRASRYGRMLGLTRPFLYEISREVIRVMAGAYPDLQDKTAFIGRVLETEEGRFLETLDGGLSILEAEVERLTGGGDRILPGALVFKLYDTYGFPVDLTADIVRKRGIIVDEEGFKEAMERQKEKSRKNWRGSGETGIEEHYRSLAQSGVRTVFTGYGGATEGESTIIALIKDGQIVDSLSEGEAGEVFVAETPFYGETGGQTGDRGAVFSRNFSFTVLDAKRPLDELISHIGTVCRGVLRVGDPVSLRVDEERRRAIEANHSATHLLQAALRSVLGDHVKQSGSLVTDERFRFDFTHFSRIEEEELKRIETLSNSYIRKNIEVNTGILPASEAAKTGAIAFFDEKYGEFVRVVQMGQISKELCGGTHVRRTGDIGLLKILNESAIAASVRRIEAATGQEALKRIQTQEDELKRAALLLKTNPGELAVRLEKQLEYEKDLEKELKQARGKIALWDSARLLGQAKDVKGVRLLAARVEAPDMKELRNFGDLLRDRLSSGIILLAAVNDQKVDLLCLVTKDLTARYQAGALIKAVAPLVGGSGGGRPELAQAGGTRVEGVKEALKKIEELM